MSETITKERVTVAKAAEKWGVDKIQANAILSGLVKMGQAAVVDKVKAAGGKGKPSNVYEVDSEVTLRF